MKTETKLIYFILSFLPLSLWLVFQLSSPFIKVAAPPNELFSFWSLYPGIFGKVTVFIIVVGICFSIYLAVLVFRKNFVKNGDNNLWGTLLIFGNIIVLPVFWFKHIKNLPAAKN